MPGPIELSPKDWHRAIVFLGQIGSESCASKPGKASGMDRLQVTASLLTSAADLLHDWPTGFRRLLHAFLSSRRSTPSLRRTFDPLYRVLYRELSGGSFDFLRVSFEEFLHEHWWGLVCERNQKLQRRTIDTHPRVPIAKAANLMGVAPSFARHMVQADLLPSKSSELPSGRRTRTVPWSEAMRIAGIARSAVSLREAARRLVLSEKRVRQLIEAGVVAPMISRASLPTAAAWAIPASEIERLMIDTHNEGASTPIALRDFARNSRLLPDEMASLANAVLQGRILCTGGTNPRSPLGAVSLDRSSARSWLKEIRRSRRADMSVDEAATYLGAKQQVAYALIKAGILLTREDAAGHLRVRRDDAREFQRVYVSLAEVARRAGTSSRTLLSRIKAAPVAGPTVDASRQYFYRRADLIGEIDCIALQTAEMP